ncbi:MAG TPA: SusC/RagA family TonB-linked outer membrane protein [Longimicrobiales bacterium]|nr:SusC/RagA family TonB-linked outer membrane protein [Longimicrobiales bacterium]
MLKRTASILLVVLLTPLWASAQQRGTITGRVVDQATNTPLIGAQIVVAGTTMGTVTNQEGRFALTQVPAGERQIRVTHLGYKGATQPVSIAAGATATVDFQLTETVLEIEGVIVTATGQEQRQREIGNSVSRISTAEIAPAPVQTLTNLLQARAAGVVIQQTSGSTGTGSRIRIRGNSSVSLDATPLVIVDGIRVSNEVESTGLFTGGTSTSRWDDINPEQIESIEILKGPAAAALYGTAAANGVVQITTKRGLGGRTEVRAYAEHARREVPSSLIPDNFRARGFRTDLNARGDCSLIEQANGTCTTVDSLYRYNPLLDAANTPLRTGTAGTLGGSIAGGSSDSRATFFIAAENERTDGVMRSNELNRTSLRANVSGLVNEKLRVTANSNFVTSYIQLPQEGNTGSGPWLNALFGGDPSPANVARGDGFRNPYTAENVGWWQNEEELRRFVFSVSADWRPTTWLHIYGVSGVDQNNRFEQGTIPVPGLATGFFAEGLREQFRTQNRELTASLNANINRSLRTNVASTTALGVQYNESRGDWSYGAGSGLAPGTLTAGQALSVQEFFGETKLLGVYGSQMLGINDRLFLTGAIRGDQNSAFGENIGFVVYPALSAAWSILDEPWFPRMDFLSSTRLRAAYGESGQRPGRLSAVRTYQSQAVALDGGITSGFIVSNAGNPDLKPEVSSEFEFGVDLGFLSDRVSVGITRYDKTTRDALIARPLPPSVGGPQSQFFNLGKVENNGWEATVRFEPVRREQLNVRFGVTLAANKNRLIEIGDTTIPPITIGLQRHVEGYPLGGYWAPAYEYADANNDGMLQFNEVTLRAQQDNEEDGLSFIGQPFPKREVGISTNIDFLKWFSLAGVLEHKGGHYIQNWGGRQRCAEATGSYCEARQVPASASLAEQARIIARRNPAVASQAGWVEKADYWKLREVSLTFNAPQSLVDRTRVARSLSISLAGRDLKTWTDYTGIDPESNIPTSVSANDDPGRFFTADLFTVPLPRTFIVRVDLGL